MALLLAGCSGGESDASLPSDAATADDSSASSAAGRRAPIELIDPGAEPRVQLGIDGPAPVTISVAATRRNAGSVGGERLEAAIAASYVLEIDLTADTGGAEYVARFQPSIVETTGFVSVEDPGSWEWRLTPNGVLTEVQSPPFGDSDAQRRLAELLSTPQLFLMVPTEPVGVGASWTYAEIDGADPVTVRLEAIRDDDLMATVTLERQRPGMRFATTATGSWLRRSLIARQVTARVELAIAATTTRDGEQVDVRKSTTGELVYEANR